MDRRRPREHKGLVAKARAMCHSLQERIAYFGAATVGIAAIAVALASCIAH